MKILIALDRSKAASYVAGYVSQATRRDSDVTLYHVAQVPSELREHGGAEDPESEEHLERSLDADLERWKQQQRIRCDREIFEPALTLFGEKPSHWQGQIKTEVGFDFQGDPARNIIQKAHGGRYDTVVIGRRSQSGLKEHIFGSVSFKVAHHLANCTVWIVE